MNSQILLPPGDVQPRKIWKTWKWIGLSLWIFALLFNRFLPDVFVTAAYLYGTVVIINLAFTGSRYLKDRLFWRVRNRLIGSFVFVGVIPLLAIFGIILLSGYLILGQLAAQYTQNLLKQENRHISDIGIGIAEELNPADPVGTFAKTAAGVLSQNSGRFPRLSARLLFRGPDGALTIVSKHDPESMLGNERRHPGDMWRGPSPSYEGFIEHGSLNYLTCLRPIPGSSKYYVEVSAPIESLEKRLRTENSIYVAFVADEKADIQITGSGTRLAKSRDKLSEEQINSRLNAMQNALKSDSRFMIPWPLTLRGKTYETGTDSETLAFLYVPGTVVLANFFGLGNQRELLGAIYVLAGLFGFAELVSLLIGFTISHRITRSVHDMYKGILALQKGDLLHRIPVRRSDQLGLLAHSFNQMSASITKLLEEVVEKKKLEQELEIAREVQATLFPKQLPHAPGMMIFGGCRPARVVSGDYYDFIVEDERNLNIVLGDISGKGISAALLMANLQASIHSQLPSSRNGSTDAVEEGLAEVMAQLNNQIYGSSPPEKYATLFLSRYDADLRRLWYCNAGHLPPILMDQNGATRVLEPTGTVVGLFPNARYEVKSIEMPPGSVLAVFTDGITEAVNKEDQEFTETRLLDALRQSSASTPESMWNHVMAKVAEWQSDLPQHDDITLILAKTS